MKKIMFFFLLLSMGMYFNIHSKTDLDGYSTFIYRVGEPDSHKSNQKPCCTPSKKIDKSNKTHIPGGGGRVDGIGATGGPGSPRMSLRELMLTKQFPSYLSRFSIFKMFQNKPRDCYTCKCGAKKLRMQRKSKCAQKRLEQQYKRLLNRQSLEADPDDLMIIPDVA